MNAATLVNDIFALFSKRKLTVATAESCTGGILATWLTDLPGSSVYYLGGVSSYSYDSKEIFLDVSHKELAANGAVSEVVAKQMALGVRKRLNASYGVAVTGIAGPDGATPGKPVGTVWIAVSGPKGEKARLLNLTGDRARNRIESAEKALGFLRDILRDEVNR